MSPRSGGDFASGAASLPMLIECDRQGHVIWSSDPTRAASWLHGNLAQLLEAGCPQSGCSLRVFQVLKVPEGLLLGAEMAELQPDLEWQDRAALRPLELKLLHHYFHLQTSASRLFERLARNKRGGGRTAVRQIELERQRVGLELHTGVGQMLAAVRMQLEIATGQLTEAPAQVRQVLENIAALVSQAFAEVRSISRRLHPPDWQRLTIEGALRQLWELSGIPLKFGARLHLHALDRQPEPEVKALLYRAAQEGLSNILEHSHARNVTMSLSQSGDLLLLVLEDDGMGFDMAALARAPVNLAAGIGLGSIGAQAAALGAKIDVASGPNGTRLVLSTSFSPEQ